MKPLLRELFSSKKFLAMIGGIAVYLGGRLGFEVDPAACDRVLVLFAVYIGAQGVADHGKSAAQVSATTTGALANGSASSAQIAANPESPS